MNLPIPRHRNDQPSPDVEFDRLHRSLVSDLEQWPHRAHDVIDSLRDVIPLADIEETDDSYVLDVELPGVSRDDISLEVAHGRLVVTGERRQRQKVGLLRRRTRTTGRFRLAVGLPVDVDATRVTAALDSGVLTVTVPKAERARRRRVPIQISGG